MDDAEFVARFGGVFERSPWVAEAAMKERPFADLDEMRRAFAGAMYAAPRERLLALLRAHPDLAGKAAVAGELTPESTAEQASAGLDRLSAEEFEAFTRTNREYRERFGIPMIVCVREHDKASILKNAQGRLNNAFEEEFPVALGEVEKISALRLRDLVSDADGRDG